MPAASFFGTYIKINQLHTGADGDPCNRRSALATGFIVKDQRMVTMRTAQVPHNLILRKKYG